MTAAVMWARAELRARWRAWLLLGLLAGVTVGVAAAGFAGARRTANAVPDLVAASRLPTAAALPNDPAFGPSQVEQVAALPGVSEVYPFVVAVPARVLDPAGVESTLFPVTPASTRALVGYLVAGRLPDARRADEVVVDENLRRRYGLDIGSTMVVGQTARDIAQTPFSIAPPGGFEPFRQRMTVVGISKSVSSDESWVPSSALYEKYGAKIAPIENLFAELRGGEAQIPRFSRAVARIAGHPVNVEGAAELFGVRKAENVTAFEEDGLLLFALVALLGGGVLVGQALVRTVSASAADLPTWRAIGADRRLAVVALALPSILTAIVAVVSTVTVAILLSSRFPVGVARQWDIDLGTHADWFVLGLGAVAVVVAIVAVATAAGWWRASRREAPRPTPSRMDRLAAPMSARPALMIGARLAGEPGRGRRAVPVRSAMIGAIAGVLGVVGCLTFRAGLQDAVSEPGRSGVVWNFALAAEGSVPGPVVRAAAADDDVAAALHATWHRAVPINGHSVPIFGTRDVRGRISFVVLQGHRPRGPGEIAFAPTTMNDLGLSVGDRVRVGDGTRTAVVVGEALLPITSHTDYDQSGWMTSRGLTGTGPTVSGTDAEDYLLVRWRPDIDVAAAETRLRRIGGGDVFGQPATLPVAVTDLGRIEDLPLALAGFFALLACATVAHALVTTVRRRRHDLAVLRSIGFTRRQTRGAIAWQATLLAIVGVVVGVPLGIATGRLAWRWLADDFPIAYVPPLAALAVVLVASVAILLANALAAGPAHVASRIRPAEALRVE